MKRKVITATASAAAAAATSRLGKEFFDQGSIELSRALLGKVLARRLPSGEIIRGTIVETEAYPGATEAATLNVHAFMTKRTEKNGGIFMDPGTTFVYMTYGVFHMMNVSARGSVHDHCHLSFLSFFNVLLV